MKTLDGMEAEMERCWTERTSARRDVRVELPGIGVIDLDVNLAFVPPDLVMLHAADITASKAAQTLTQTIEKTGTRVRGCRRPKLSKKRPSRAAA